MARYKDNILSGKLGPYVFRNDNGRQIVTSRVASGKIKQTEQTKNAASTFGMASSLGSHIRQTFETEIAALQDREMTNRITSLLNRALILSRNPVTKKFSFGADIFNEMEGFDFNSRSPLKKSLTKPLNISMDDGKLQVLLPDLSVPNTLKFPSGSSSCQLTVNVGLFRLYDGLKIYQPISQDITIQKTKPVLGEQKFEFEIPDGCFCVVTLFLKYSTTVKGKTVLINSKTFSPAAICLAVITPGNFTDHSNYSWAAMQRLIFEA